MKHYRDIDYDKYDVVIIGSGMGGLTCAANLVHEGLSTLVLEQHFKPGGATSMFKRKDFLFEAGGHRITGIQNEDGPLRKILTKIGCNLEVEPLDPVYVVKLGDRTLVAPKKLEEYIENVKLLFPEKREKITRFFADLLDFIEGLNYVRQAKRTNPFVLAGKYRTFIRYANKTLHKFMYDHFQDLDIVLMLTVLGNYTTLPLEQQSMLNFATIWAAHHLGEGMSLIKGGTKALINILADYINTSGGRVVVDNKVSAILTQSKKAIGVRTEQGQEIKAKIVISNASNEQTFLKMLNRDLFARRFIHKIENQQQSGGVFQLYLGIEERDGKGLQSVTTFMLGDDVPEGAADFFNRVYAWDLDAITSGGVITVEGAEHAPSGYRSINISSLIPYAHPENWYIKGKDKREYRKFKKRIAARIIQTMSTYIPDLGDRIVVMDTATPLTLERYTNATKGGLQGLAHTPAQSGAKRGSLQTPIKNLYQVGQYVFPGAGIVTTAMSGNLCSALVMDKHFI